LHPHIVRSALFCQLLDLRVSGPSLNYSSDRRTRSGEVAWTVGRVRIIPLVLKLFHLTYRAGPESRRAVAVWRSTSRKFVHMIIFVAQRSVFTRRNLPQPLSVGRTVRFLVYITEAESASDGLCNKLACMRITANSSFIQDAPSMYIVITVLMCL